MLGGNFIIIIILTQYYIKLLYILIMTDPDNISELKTLVEKQELEESEYKKLLDLYVKEKKNYDKDNEEKERLSLLERTLTPSFFDIFFPLHMYLGKMKHSEEGFTTLKSYNLRRDSLIWLFYEKFDRFLTPEEKERRNYAEFLMFKYNMIFKSISLTTFLYTLLRFHKRPMVMNGVWLYISIESFLLSYVVGVDKAWGVYKDLAKKVRKSGIKVDAEKDLTVLEEFKVNWYRWDIAISTLL